jgi:hypothetical protein
VKFQNNILKGVEMIILAASLGAAASAQITPGRGDSPFEGNLKNDIREGPDRNVGQGGAFDGPVLEGGSVFVDLDGKDHLELSIETWPVSGKDPQGVRPPRLERKKTVRLAGGKPQNAGAILVSLSEPARRSTRLASPEAVIMGFFEADGSFAVDLPDVDEDVFVQGMEFTPLGNATSGIFRVASSGAMLPLEPSTWDAESISDAVHQATQDLRDELVSLRFFGAARMGKLSGNVNVTVLLGRSLEHGRETLSMFLRPALARRLELVSLGEDRGVTFFARDVKSLVGAVEAVIMLDAFDGMNVDLQWARARLEAMRTRPGHPVQPESPDFQRLGQLDEPRRAGEKQPLPELRKHGAGKFEGTIHDAGSVRVDLGDEEESVVGGVEVLGQLDEPRRAGEKQPLPKRKRHGGSRYAGSIDDAGARMADLSERRPVRKDGRKKR